jgi:hypothetical protein
MADDTDRTLLTVGYGCKQCDDVSLQKISRMFQNPGERELVEQGDLHVVSISCVSGSRDLTQPCASVRKPPAWQS